jgi:hypothetical protein
MLGRYQPEIICLFSFARTLKERKKNNERKMDKHKYNECAISILTHHFFLEEWPGYDLKKSTGATPLTFGT